MISYGDVNLITYVQFYLCIGRPSCVNLVNIACEGIASVNTKATKISLCTTPVVHYLVKCKNDSSYGVPTTEGYYNKLITAFETLWKEVNFYSFSSSCTSYRSNYIFAQTSNTNGNYTPNINFDGANGVGSVAIEYVKKRIQDKLTVNVYNDSINDHEKLNLNVSLS